MKIRIGNSDVEQYIVKLQRDATKDGRIKAKKITAYFRRLKELGVLLREPYCKKVTSELWELRPLRDRFMYAFLENNNIIVLTQFMKTTEKIPKNEIEKAEKRLKIYKKRGEMYEGMERD